MLEVLGEMDEAGSTASRLQNKIDIDVNNRTSRLHLVHLSSHMRLQLDERDLDLSKDTKAWMCVI
jgi:hypothetical protein